MNPHHVFWQNLTRFFSFMRNTEVDVKAGGGCTMTMGEMLRHFLSKLEWYSTLFPRIPVPIQKDIEMKLAPYGPIVRAGGPGACPAIGRPGEEEIPFAGSFREGEHIPDDEVSYGEAERVARLRRSSSRERRSRRDENKNGDVDEYGREKQGRDSREKDHKSSRGSSHHRHKRHHSRDRKRKPRSRSPGTGRSHSTEKKARRRSRSGSHGHHHRSSHSRSREH